MARCQFVGEPIKGANEAKEAKTSSGAATSHGGDRSGSQLQWLTL